jgi:hypothetical protein
VSVGTAAAAAGRCSSFEFTAVDMFGAYSTDSLLACSSSQQVLLVGATRQGDTNKNHLLV